MALFVGCECTTVELNINPLIKTHVSTSLLSRSVLMPRSSRVLLEIPPGGLVG